MYQCIHVLLVTATLLGSVCLWQPATGATPVANMSNIDWRHWLTKLSELAVPPKDSSGGGISNVIAADDPKQLSAIWNVINFARYILCKAHLTVFCFSLLLISWTHNRNQLLHCSLFSLFI